MGIVLNTDGAWHQYTAEIKSGAFPPTINPNLRIWILERAQTVWLDDVTLEAVGGGKALELPVKVTAED